MASLGIRSQLTLLILLTTVPALALFGYETLEKRAKADAAAETELNTLATLAASQQRDVVEGARLTLAAISHTVPWVRGNAALCTRFFAELLRESQGLYHSMGLYDAQGVLECNALPWQGVVRALDRRYFTEAMRSGKFSVGEYQIGRVTRQEGINFGFPVFSEGDVSSVAFVAMNLGNFGMRAAATPLPEEGILTVLDGNGNILARSPANAGRLGDKPQVPEVNAALRKGENAIFRAKDSNGAVRLFAFHVVVRDALGAPAFSVVASVPLEVVHAAAHREILRNIAILLIATVLLVMVAWFGAERFLLRNVRALSTAARHISGGDMSARAELVNPSNELADVGNAFDQMAAALQSRHLRFESELSSVQQDAVTDRLTGLANRRYLDQFLPRELQRAQRQGSVVAAIMLDVDHFKRFNDRVGHDAGDQVLRALGGALLASVRGSDIACRYGGEEFTVVLLDTEREGARRKAEEIRAAIAALHLEHNGRPLGQVTASLGIALYPGHDDATSLLRAADKALYCAKESGRNRVILSEDAAPIAA